MKKVLFIDRDGTIIIEPPVTFQVDSLEKLEYYPGAISNLSRIADELDYELVLVTNQDGLGTASFPEEDFWLVQNKMITTLQNEGINFSEVCIDKSFESENLPTRKPGVGMLQKYIYGNYDLSNSFVIGDRITDVQLAKNLKCKSIFIGNDTSVEADLVTTSWKDIYRFLKDAPRKVNVTRNTSETQISVNLNLDGVGISKVNTGIGFFNHMLDQLARHGGLDLEIEVLGDLHIDEHHTIEDVAITLGQAFEKALGSKKGINRYGFLLPMDDVLAQAAIDFGGRPWLVWNVKFNREKIGDMPTEMMMHFFKSFSDAAKCNLNIQADGGNEHHKIEAIFKATAKAIKMAVEKSNTNSIPSTKGIL